MPTTQPRKRSPGQPEISRHVATFARRIAAVFALAAVVAITIHYVNRGLEASLPDPFHSPVGATPPPAARPSAFLPVDPVPSYFPAQFPPPQGSIEAQPDAY